MAGDVDILGLLSDDARSRLLLGARSFTLPAGTVTYSVEDTIADVVESGLVRIFVSSADGRQASFAYVHARSFYGAPTILGVGMSTSAQTLTETRLLRLDARHVVALFEEDLEIAKALAHVMASRISQAARLVTSGRWGRSASGSPTTCWSGLPTSCYVEAPPTSASRTKSWLGRLALRARWSAESWGSGAGRASSMPRLAS
jgi:CRP-like cAMP-binding protein